LKEEALDRTMWRHRFGGGIGPVVRQNTKGMNDSYVLCRRLLIEESNDWQIICEYIPKHFGQLSQYSVCATGWAIQQPGMDSRRDQETAVNWEGYGVIQDKLNMRFAGLSKAIHKSKIRADIWTHSLMKENCYPNKTKCGSDCVFAQDLKHGASQQLRLCDVQC